MAPASAVATDANPGTNLAKSIDDGPKRWKIDSVCRTQVSCDSDTRHNVLRMRMPNLRPAAYQPVSAIKAPATPTPTSSYAGAPPMVASAPATISVGYAGKGNPACSASTFRKTKPKPYWWRSAISCSKGGP